jgi:hypothetical protein
MTTWGVRSSMYRTLTSKWLQISNLATHLSLLTTLRTLSLVMSWLLHIHVLWKGIMSKLSLRMTSFLPFSCMIVMMISWSPSSKMIRTMVLLQWNIPCRIMMEELPRLTINSQRMEDDRGLISVINMGIRLSEGDDLGLLFLGFASFSPSCWFISIISTDGLSPLTSYLAMALL